MVSVTGHNLVYLSCVAISTTHLNACVITLLWSMHSSRCFAAQCITKPGYCVAKPEYCVAKPGFCVAKPGFCVAKPGYCVAKPGYCVAKPGFCVAKPGFCVAKPGYCVANCDAIPGTLCPVYCIVYLLVMVASSSER